MEQTALLKQVEQFVFTKFKTDNTGHDYHHMQRVAKLAKHLAISEREDPFICEVSAWIHDVIDDKLTSNPDQEKNKVIAFLGELGITDQHIQFIIETITTVSYRKKKWPTSKVGQIVQDADRLDAIGAIGIARAFSYGASNGQPIYVPGQEEQEQSTVQHFSDKLLLIKDKLHTDTAIEIAQDRHERLVIFLENFKQEWHFLD